MEEERRQIQGEFNFPEAQPVPEEDLTPLTNAQVDSLSADQSKRVVNAAEGIKEQNKTSTDNKLNRFTSLSKKLKNKFSEVDDDYRSGLPQAIWTAYKTGEFGNIRKVEKKDENGETVLDKNGKPVMEYEDPEAAKKARSTKNYFIWNTIGNALANIGYKTNNMSDWDKVKTTNLEKALERRNKLKEDTLNTTTDKLKDIVKDDTEMQRVLDLWRQDEQFKSIMSANQNENDVIRAFNALKSLGGELKGLSDKDLLNLSSAMLITGKGDLKSTVGLLLSTEDGRELAEKVVKIAGDGMGAIGNLFETASNGFNVPMFGKDKPVTTRDNETVTKSNATDSEGKATDVAKKLPAKDFITMVGDSIALETLRTEIPGATDNVLKAWKNNWGSLDFNNFVARYKPMADELEALNTELKNAKKEIENAKNRTEKSQAQKRYNDIDKTIKEKAKARDNWLKGK